MIGSFLPEIEEIYEEEKLSFLRSKVVVVVESKAATTLDVEVKVALAAAPALEPAKKWWRSEIFWSTRKKKNEEDRGERKMKKKRNRDVLKLRIPDS